MFCIPSGIILPENLLQAQCQVGKPHPMPYQFVPQDQDYSDYAGGRVLYSLPGLPAFPVRLASEIFLRAYARIQAARPAESEKRLTLYDPTCGGAYHLTTLGLLHGQAIGAILASDVDANALALAQRNLGLLSLDGLERRQQELRRLFDRFGKESHAQALSSAAVLRDKIESAAPIRTRVFQADALKPDAVQNGLAGETAHLVISDIPYGQLSGWRLPENPMPDDPSPVWRLLEALLPALAENAIVAIAADKSQKIAHAGFRRVERFQIGKRQVSLLTLIRSS